MNLSKDTETASTITLKWTPPANVEAYVLYANGQPTVASKNMKDGTPRQTAKFSKTAPGPPFEVVAVMRSGAGQHSLDVGVYSSNVFPDSTRYPSEAL